MVDRPVPAPGQTDELVHPVVSARPPAVTSGRFRSGAIVARSLWIAAAVLCGLVVSITARAEPGTPMQFDPALVELVAIVVLFPTVGLLVALRRPESYAGWAMLVFGVAFGVVVLLAAYASAGLPPASRRLPGATLALWADNLAFVPVLSVFATLFLLYFPNGRLLDPRWRLALVLLAVVNTAYVIGWALLPGEVYGVAGVTNPFGAPTTWSAALHALADLGNLGALVAVLVGVASVVQRYRSAARLERYQIRWIALLGIGLATAFTVGIFQISPISDIGWSLGFVFIALLPIAVGIAITRYRLYDIDEIINRTIVYAALSAILAGLFTASITMSQRVFSAVTGERSDAAIVVTTLVVVTAYTPIRKWLESVVDRRFKFESPRFGAYRAQLRETLDLVDPDRARGRLVREVVRELAAAGGAIVTERAGIRTATHTVGEWAHTAVALSLPIQTDPEGEHLELTGRLDGRAYSERDVVAVREVLDLASRAIGLVGRHEPVAAATR